MTNISHPCTSRNLIKLIPIMYYRLWLLLSLLSNRAEAPLLDTTSHQTMDIIYLLRMHNAGTRHSILDVATHTHPSTTVHVDFDTVRFQMQSATKWTMYANSPCHQPNSQNNNNKLSAHCIHVEWNGEPCTHQRAHQCWLTPDTLSLSLSALHLTPVGWCHLNWTIGFHSTSLINVFWYQFDQSEPYQFESDLGERATFKCCQCEFWTHYKTPTSVCAQFDMHYVTLMVHRWYA